MTLTTFKKIYNVEEPIYDEYEIENYEEIEEIKQINIIPSPQTKKILIDYRLKNKKYSFLEWDELDIPNDYEIIISED